MTTAAQPGMRNEGSTPLPELVVPAGGASLRALALLEAKRYARHPLFLIGLVLGIATSAGERGPIELDYQVIPSFFIGVFGVVVAARLAASTRVARPIVDAAPTSPTRQTAALCLACVVPGLAGLGLVLLHRAFVASDGLAGWKYGTYGSIDRTVITMALPVVACVGAPLVGVAAGRWLRFPGAGLLAVVALLGWSAVVSYVPEQSHLDPASAFARILHMAGPYTSWASGDADGEHPLTRVRSFTGSPSWFLLWTVSLSALAAVTALFWGAQDTTLRRLRVWAAGLVVVAIAAAVLAAFNGNHRQYDTTTNGTTATGQTQIELTATRPS